jgi:uncharacterized protein (TIGR01777 family)
MRILISGATGLVGDALGRSAQAQGHTVTALTRSPRTPSDIRWDPSTGQIDSSRLSGFDAVVHLAGESIAAGRWTAAKKQAILDSRVDGTRLLCTALAELDDKPPVLVSASAIGYYGSRGDQRLDESSTPGDLFLSRVCQQWEAATAPAASAGIRVVLARFGVILAAHGGALAVMLLPFRMGLGGVVGDGQQIMSWIALDDAVRAILSAIEQSSLSGPVNVVAPHPVSNREFTKSLGRVLGRPTVLPMPAFAARIALGPMADELLLASANVVPGRLTAAGFSFVHPHLEPALRQILGKN